MDVVIPVRPGPNEELRFALRSLSNLPHNNVHIIGEPPAWVNRQTVNVIHRGKDADKPATVTGHMIAACTNSDITDPFILTNDDIYTTQPLQELPILNRGLIVAVIADLRARGIRSTYTESMQRTLAVLENNGHPQPLSYELHTPLPIHKQPMLDGIRLGQGVARWNRRTAYGNIAQLGGKTIRDPKIQRFTDKPTDGPFLSTNDTSFRWTRPHLEALFPTPSPYEA